MRSGQFALGFIQPGPGLILYPSRTSNECGISLKNSHAQTSRGIWLLKNQYFGLSGLCITLLKLIPAPHSSSPQVGSDQELKIAHLRSQINISCKPCLGHILVRKPKGALCMTFPRWCTQVERKQCLINLITITQE